MMNMFVICSRCSAIDIGFQQYIFEEIGETWKRHFLISLLVSKKPSVQVLAKLGNGEDAA